jgi:hypothetical protein
MSNELIQVYQKKMDSLMPLITPQDKADLLKSKLVSRPTLEAYMKGEVVKVGTAHKIIDFFQSRIDARIKVYKNQSAA